MKAMFTTMHVSSAFSKAWWRYSICQEVKLRRLYSSSANVAARNQLKPSRRRIRAVSCDVTGALVSFQVRYCKRVDEFM